MPYDEFHDLTEVEPAELIIDLNSPPSAEEARPSLPQRVNGRFAPGVSGNPAGRPPGRSIKKVFAEKLHTEMNLEEAAQLLAETARSGNVDAIKLFLNYLVGKPAEEKNITKTEQSVKAVYHFRDNGRTNGGDQ